MGRRRRSFGKKRGRARKGVKVRKMKIGYRM